MAYDKQTKDEVQALVEQNTKRMTREQYLHPQSFYSKICKLQMLSNYIAKLCKLC